MWVAKTAYKLVALKVYETAAEKVALKGYDEVVGKAAYLGCEKVALLDNFLVVWMVFAAAV